VAEQAQAVLIGPCSRRRTIPLITTHRGRGRQRPNPRNLPQESHPGPSIPRAILLQPGNLGSPVFKTRYATSECRPAGTTSSRRGAGASLEGARSSSVQACSTRQRHQSGSGPSWHPSTNASPFRVERIGTEGTMTFYGKSFCVDEREFVPSRRRHRGGGSGRSGLHRIKLVATTGPSSRTGGGFIQSWYDVRGRAYGREAERKSDAASSGGAARRSHVKRGSFRDRSILVKPDALSERPGPADRTGQPPSIPQFKAGQQALEGFGLVPVVAGASLLGRLWPGPISVAPRS